MDKKYAVLTDFDGTISTVDVGDQVIRRFIKVNDSDKLEKAFRDKAIGSIELYNRLYAGFIGTAADVIEYVKAFTLDPYFKAFTEFCKYHDIALAVLSDGFQYYIDALFDKYNITDTTVYCNKAFFTEKGVVLDFPYRNPYCSICANCKAGAYIKYKDIGYTVIFIGDGFSDRYVAERADIVFAKSHLAEYCDKNGIPYTPFNDFNDIMAKLSSMLSL